MLDFIRMRHICRPSQFVTIQEIKLFNMAKVILDGGWVFDEGTLEEIMGITGIDKVVDYYRITLLKSYESKKELWRPPTNIL